MGLDMAWVFCCCRLCVIESVAEADIKVAVTRAVTRALRFLYCCAVRLLVHVISDTEAPNTHTAALVEAWQAVYFSQCSIRYPLPSLRGYHQLAGTW